MQISVTFKKIDPSDTLKNYVHDKMNRLDKYWDTKDIKYDFKKCFYNRRPELQSDLQNDLDLVIG